MDRDVAVRVAWSFIGRPYIWGGDDPILGFDCSGFVIEILKSIGILPHSGDWSAHGLYGMFINKKTTNPTAGCLVFWENGGRMTHVEFCLNERLSIGASGGGSATTSEQAAIDQNAYIKVRPFKSRGTSDTRFYVDPFAESDPNLVNV